MVTPSIIQVLARPRLYVCMRCAFRASNTANCQVKVTRRSIGLKYLVKKANAESEWQEQAKLIQAGKKKSMLSILEERGLVNAIAGSRDALDHLMTTKRIGAYVGIDPTAPSLHVGHLLPLMSLFWLYLHGFHAVSLIGGATAKVGDPTGRLQTRKRQHSALRNANMVNMHYQMKKLWVSAEQWGRKYGYEWKWAWRRELVNNHAWMNKLPLMEFLQVLGPGARVGAMLGKETVQTKMDKGDGLSFSEFSYPLLQAWDWWHMYNTKGVQLQIGGGDQYGNIVAGIDGVKYIAKNHHDPRVREKFCKPDPLQETSNQRSILDQKREVDDKTELDEKMIPYGFTVPLLTTSSGEKYGKSAGNAVWLDKDITSTFDLYQYFVRTPDTDCERFLRLFSFLPVTEIDSIMAKNAENPSARLAQHTLAREVVGLVHGEVEASEAEQKHRLIFSRGGSTSGVLTETESNAASESGKTLRTPAHLSTPSPNMILPRSLVINQSIASVLHAAGLVSSRSEGHRLAKAEGAYIGSKADGTGGMDAALSFTPTKLWKPEVTEQFLIDDELFVLRVGKWKVKVVRLVSDEEFLLSGEESPPGWENYLQQREKDIDMKQAERAGKAKLVKEEAQCDKRAQ